MKEKLYTARELAEKFGVIKRVAQGWIQRNYFPNAKKQLGVFDIPFWTVPESDLVGFTPPAGRGKPQNPDAPKSAVVRRKK